MSVRKKWWFKPVIGFIIVTALFFYSIAREASNNRTYFNDLNLTLKGEVLAADVPNGYNGFGILRVKILASNINYYDPRGKIKNYYCIIKNGIAEVYQHGISECESGDIVTVDARKREFTIYKKDGKNFVRDIVLYTNEFFYKYLQKYQKL
jgi:hypothetical protein